MLHGFLGVLRCDLVRNQDIVRRIVLFQITDDALEILGLCVARAANVKLFLNEKLGGERNVLLGVADADDAAGEGNLVDGHLMHLR